MIKSKSSFMVILGLIILSGCQPQGPKVQNGVIDFSSENFEKLTPIELRGSWSFELGAFYQDFSSLKGTIQVPSSWSWQETGPKGFGTYALRVLLPQGFDQALGIKFPVVGSSYQLFANGEKILSRGKPGKDLSTTVGDYASDTVILLPTLWGESSTLDLIVHVANFHDQFGGISRPPLLGLVKGILDQSQWATMLEAGMATAAMTLGMYLLIFSFFRDRNKVLFFFGLFCLSVGLRSLFYGEVLIQVLFPPIPWDLVIRGVYFFLISGVCCFIWYVHRLFPKQSRRLVPWIVTGLLGLYLPINLLAPVEIFTAALGPIQGLTLLVALYGLGVIIRAWHHKVPGALTLAIGLGIFILTLIWDIIASDFFHFLPSMVGFGLLGLLFYQALMMGRSFSTAYRDLESTLEKLESTKESLIQSEKMAGLGILVASVAHEVNNPISAISSSINNLEIHWEKCNDLWNTLADSPPEIDKALWTQFKANVRRLPLPWKEEDSLRHEWNLNEQLKSLEPSKTRRLAGLLSHLGVYSLEPEFLSQIISGQGPEVLELISSGLEMKRSMVTIRSSVERTIRLVQGLTLYSKASTFREIRDLDIVATWKGALLQWSELEARGIHFETHFESRLPLVKGIPEELTQIWSNLIQNALQAIGHKGKIKVTVALSGDGVLSEILDTGPGISPEILTRIFEPFFTTKSLGEGTGLGLAIVKQLVEKAGGWIEASSPTGGGALFQVWIPKGTTKAGV